MKTITPEQIMSWDPRPCEPYTLESIHALFASRPSATALEVLDCQGGHAWKWCLVRHEP